MSSLTHGHIFCYSIQHLILVTSTCYEIRHRQVFSSYCLLQQSCHSVADSIHSIVSCCCQKRAFDIVAGFLHRIMTTFSQIRNDLVFKLTNKNQGLPLLSCLQFLPLLFIVFPAQGKNCADTRATS